MKTSLRIVALVVLQLTTFTNSRVDAATSYVATILHPLGATESLGFAASDSGQEYTPNVEHATLWNGTPDSAVDLHPVGFQTSVATGISGGFQVGYVDEVGFGKAMLWSGSAASAVNLHPAGFDGSKASGVSGNTQVGEAIAGITTHAMLWNGTAASVVDLNPAGYSNSRALRISGNFQVGAGKRAQSHDQARTAPFFGMAQPRV